MVVKNCNSISLPMAYKRLSNPSESFAAWLGNFPFAASNKIYLYSGAVSPNQQMQYSVLDLSIGNQNLQQCADAIMRLRSEYFFAQGKYSDIHFQSRDIEFNYTDYLNGMRYTLQREKLVSIKNATEKLTASKSSLHEFLKVVFTYCGSYSLYEASKRISGIEVLPGDMLIKPGSPGHAMMVMDVAVDTSSGKKIALLAQGYMPAQSVHIVKNDMDNLLNPWYDVRDETISTPGFIFDNNSWYRWK